MCWKGGMARPSCVVVFVEGKLGVYRGVLPRAKEFGQCSSNSPVEFSPKGCFCLYATCQAKSRHFAVSTKD